MSQATPSAITTPHGETPALRQRLPSPALGPLRVPEAGFMRKFYGEAVRWRAQPFRGVRANQPVKDNLFPVAPTGISAAPILAAAEKMLDAFSFEQRGACMFGIESDNWRSWCNFHIYLFRHGVCLVDLDPTQRERVYDLMQASLSPHGFELAVNLIRINQHMADISGRTTEFGENFFWISIFGVPSPTEPWGWQIDGQHLAINCFVLGDQVVVSPTFMGAEPVKVESGRYKGIRVFAEEERMGLEAMLALEPAQRERARLGTKLPFDVFAHSFNDNVELPYQGLPVADMTTGQRDAVIAALSQIVARERAGHSDLRLKQVLAHLDETWFAWIGGVGDDDPFYYRIHSPVFLLEFDHQPGVMFANDEHTRRHIHTVTRTPNGNDYGKALLRQYYERVRQSPLHEGGDDVATIDTVKRFGATTIV